MSEDEGLGKILDVVNVTEVLRNPHMPDDVKAHVTHLSENIWAKGCTWCDSTKRNLEIATGVQFDEPLPRMPAAPPYSGGIVTQKVPIPSEIEPYEIVD